MKLELELELDCSGGCCSIADEVPWGMGFEATGSYDLRRRDLFLGFSSPSLKGIKTRGYAAKRVINTQPRI